MGFRWLHADEQSNTYPEYCESAGARLRALCVWGKGGFSRNSAVDPKYRESEGRTGVVKTPQLAVSKSFPLLTVDNVILQGHQTAMIDFRYR
jgi:hypothetical protein